MEYLQTVEKELKKTTLFRFGPRTIDLDLLLYGEKILPPNTKKWQQSYPLVIPHPKLHLRRFVLEPLIELAGPIKVHPTTGSTFGELLNEVKNQRCEKTDLRL